MSTNRSHDDLEALADRLRALPAVPVPAGLEARLLAAIPDAGALAPGFQSRRWQVRLWLGGALAAAAVLLAVLLVSRLGKTDGTQDGPHSVPQPSPGVVAERPPSPGNYRVTELNLTGRLKADPAQMPASFEWPVLLVTPTTTRHVPEDLTD
jgi:hypothetical protein